jgi:peptidoglycan-associated lipoprotein
LKKANYLVLVLVIVSMAFFSTACKKKKPPVIEPPTTDQGQMTTDTMTEHPPKEVVPGTEGNLVEITIDEITRQFQPVFFDFNKSDIREDQISALQNNASILKKNPNVSVLIEGHCDERGTVEYNLALGDRRAKAAQEYLVSLGIAENRTSVISYGKSRPFAEGHDEDAWRLNRRDQFIGVKK